MIEMPRPPFDLSEPRLVIFGIGSAASNALDRLILDGAPASAGLVAMNTDSQALAASVAPNKVLIGQTRTRGLGCGGDAEVGRIAAEEGIGDLLGTIEGATVVFILAGLGGGTGSGVAPVLAEVAREHGALVVVFATLPFGFEGNRRGAQARQALAELRATADVVVCFENDRMSEAVAPDAPITDAFATADSILSRSVRSLAAMASRRGLVHLGFDEVAAAMRGASQRSIFGCGEGTGDNRAREALGRALRSPLLSRATLRDALETLIVNVTGGTDLTLNEVQILMSELNRHVRPETRIFFGTAVDPTLDGALSVALLGGYAVEEVAEVRLAPSVAVVEEVEAIEEVEEPVIEEEEEVYLPPPPSREITEVRSAREIRQEQMQFDTVSRGRFEKSEPTIVDGEDLDVPTFLRRKARKP